MPFGQEPQNEYESYTGNFLAGATLKGAVVKLAK
jgi:hypothetical protein